MSFQLILSESGVAHVFLILKIFYYHYAYVLMQYKNIIVVVYWVFNLEEEGNYFLRIWQTNWYSKQ
jgi:hypothetical protein